MLELAADVLDDIVAHCLRSLPLEGCGLLVGDAASARVQRAAGMTNAAASALIYTLDPAEHLAVDRAAERDGLEVIGAFHSHTHTDAWPSATDVAAAVDPSWHWLIVSLRHPEPLVRSFVIVDGAIDEERVTVRGGMPPPAGGL